MIRNVEETDMIISKLAEMLADDDDEMFCNYRLSETYYQLAIQRYNMSFFGKKEEIAANKMIMLSALNKYFERAKKRLMLNLGKRDSNCFAKQSAHAYAHMEFLSGFIIEIVGDGFSNATIPNDLSIDEKRAYQELLNEKYYEVIDAAIVKYENAIKNMEPIINTNNYWKNMVENRLIELKSIKR